MLSLFLTLALQAAAPAVADPLAPARIGDLQCYRPDPVRKTCRSLAGYAFAADGRLDVTPLITATIGFDSVAKAFEALGSAEHHAKILIDPTSNAAL